jgi:1,4-dihydroxy-2-naphthoyl-CoA hydrolase
MGQRLSVDFYTVPMDEELTQRFSGGPNVNKELGVEVMLATPEKVVLQVEVGPKVHQPFGILHGGVSALMAEGAASLGGAVSVGPGEMVVGTELNCSHLRPMSSGTLTATATPVRKGRNVHVWAIDLTDENGRMICVARCTLQVLKAPTAPST